MSTRCPREVACVSTRLSCDVGLSIRSCAEENGCLTWSVCSAKPFTADPEKGRLATTLQRERAYCLERFFYSLFLLSVLTKGVGGALASSRCLNLHEYQSKELMRKHGVSVQQFEIATNAEDAGRAAKQLGECTVCVRALPWLKY